MMDLVSIITYLMVLSACVGSVYMLLLRHSSRRYDILKEKGIIDKESWTKTVVEAIVYLGMPSYRSSKEDTQELDDLRTQINGRLVVFWIAVLVTIVGVVSFALFYPSCRNMV